MPDRFTTQYGPAAVVAGASEGLGEAFAVALAMQGMDLVLVARRSAKLASLASRLDDQFGVSVRTIAVDLGDPAGRKRVAEETAAMDVGLMVYNAAASTIGPFLATPAERHSGTLEVNISGATELTHTFGGRMAVRGRGGIILMTSISAFGGSPLIATYAATKAYLLSLAEALSFELDDRGVDVLAVCAGATRTPGYVSSRPRNRGLISAPEMDAEDVVAEAIAALGSKPVVITGVRNRFSHLVLRRLLPRRLAVRIMGRAMNRLYGSDDGG